MSVSLTGRLAGPDAGRKVADTPVARDHSRERKGGGDGRMAGQEGTTAEHDTDDGVIADAVPGNWVDTLAPAGTRPYLRLARADRPIGAWLLLLPCWWSAGLAAVAMAANSGAPAWPNAWHLVLFAIGAYVMRAAGCTYNDLVDRDIDAKVARTAQRPIASGAISAKAAAIFMVLLSLTGFVVLIQFNLFAIGVGIASLAVVAVYPFMKRVTHWPQAVLGLAFSWGALMGWAGAFGHLDAPALVLYAATVFWVIGYDTIYAHQDREDDAMLGLGSTALKFGSQTPYWLTGFYGATIMGLLCAGLLAGAGPVFVTLLGFGAAHLVWQVATLDVDDGANCLARFKSNRDFGLIVTLALVADSALR